MNSKSYLKNSRRKLPGLDGIRAVALIGVVAYHLYPANVKGGYLGVTLFFVLSGYLIAVTSEYDRRSRRFSPIYFYRKRLKRIWPSMILTVLVTAGILTLTAPTVLVGMRREVLSIFLGYNNWYQIAENSSYFTRIANQSPFTHMWSLAIEIQFYLIWPFLYVLFRDSLRRSEKSRWFWGGLLLVLALLMPLLYRSGQDPSRVYYGTDTRIIALLLGAAAGLGRSGRKRRRSGKRKGALCLVFCLLCLAALWGFLNLDGQSEFTYRGGMLMFSLIFTGIVVLAADAELGNGKYLDILPLAWIGKRSYECYLWHYPIFYLFDRMGWNGSMIFVIIKLVMTLLVSCWMHGWMSRSGQMRRMFWMSRTRREAVGLKERKVG